MLICVCLILAEGVGNGPFKVGRDSLHVETMWLIAFGAQAILSPTHLTFINVGVAQLDNVDKIKSKKNIVRCKRSIVHFVSSGNPTKFQDEERVIKTTGELWQCYLFMYPFYKQLMCCTEIWIQLSLPLQQVGVLVLCLLLRLQWRSGMTLL